MPDNELPGWPVTEPTLVTYQPDADRPGVSRWWRFSTEHENQIDVLYYHYGRSLAFRPCNVALINIEQRLDALAGCK